MADASVKKSIPERACALRDTLESGKGQGRLAGDRFRSLQRFQGHEGVAVLALRRVLAHFE